MLLSTRLYPVYSKCIDSEYHRLVTLRHCGPFSPTWTLRAQSHLQSRLSPFLF